MSSARTTSARSVSPARRTATPFVDETGSPKRARIAPARSRSAGSSGIASTVGRPTVEAVPADPGDRERAAEILKRFGEPCGSENGVAVRLESGEADLAGVVRALDAEHLKVEHLQLHQPSLDDVFLAKTGRSLEGAEDEEEHVPGGLAMEPA